jgi:maleylacetoacetate isomerase/maleylpyruvate isomerase
MAVMARKLFTYWRSQAAYRVRIALHLKRLAAEAIDLDLLRGDQFAADYRAVNPEMVVPTLIEDDQTLTQTPGQHAQSHDRPLTYPLTQSLAILEYLDERYPQPPLLPSDIGARAYVRAIAQTVAIDAHPFIVPRVRKYLEEELGAGEAARAKWVAHWLDEGSRAVEALLARDGRSGKFCCGEAPTIADICLVAHFTSAKLFGAREVADFPTARLIFAACMEMEAFASTHPLRQAGAVATAPV